MTVLILRLFQLSVAPECRPEHGESANAVTAAETDKDRPIEGKGEQIFHEMMLAPDVAKERLPRSRDRRDGVVAVGAIY